MSAGESRFTKGLLGCAIGCGALLVVGIALTVGLYYWFSAPGPQVATTTFVGPDSLGAFHTAHPMQDEGIADLVQKLLIRVHEMQREQADEIPFPFAFLMGDPVRRARDNQEELERNMPREVTLSVELPPGEESPAAVVAVNLARFPRLLHLMAWFIARGQPDKEEAGWPLYCAEEEFCSAFVENTLLLSVREPALRHVLKRYGSGTPAELVGLARELEELEPRWNLRGVVLNREGFLSHLLQGLPAGMLDPATVELLSPELEKLDRARVGFDVVSADLAEGMLTLDFQDEESATRLAQLLESGSADLQESIGETLDRTVKRDGTAVSFTWRIERLADVIAEKLLEASQRERRERRERRRDR